jgi:hypothetical protein
MRTIASVALAAVGAALLPYSLGGQTVTTTGTPTANTIPEFTGSSSIGNSPLSISGSSVGIGTSSPQAVLDLEVSSDPVTGGPTMGLKVNNKITAGSTANYPQNYLQSLYSGSGTQSFEYGIVVDTQQVGSGTLSKAYGGYFTIENNNSPTGASITNAFGVDITSPTGGGPISTSYGLHIGPQLVSGVTNAYGIYQAGSSDIDYFAGKIGIGTPTPAYQLDVAGQIRSSTGGIVFPDGSVQTTAFNSTAAQQLQFVATALQATSSSTSTGGIGGEIDSINTSKTAPGTAYRWSIYNMTGNYGNSLQFWDYDTIGCTAGGMCSPRLTLMDSGNVGIATTTPAAPLDVNGILRVEGNVNPATTSQGGYLGWDALTGGTGETDFINNQGDGTGGFAFMNTPSSGSPRTTLMFLDGAGQLGIGTTSPGAALEVDGNVKLTAQSGASIIFQDGTTQNTAYTGPTCGGDFAESVNVAGNRRRYEPGDLLAIDPKAPGKFLEAAQPYSTLVAGVYSTKPGYVGRRLTGPKSVDEVPLAMVGIVPIKVTAENGSIHSGDLLVASSTPGRAMKGTDHSRLTGAVVGKALGNLDSGTGTIEVLVTLQ